MYASTRAKGFTLLELMITVAIIGVLAAISIPSYMSHMIKVRRAAAAACLMEGAQYAERYYTTNMSYDGVVAKIQAGPSPIDTCKKDVAVHYTIGGENNDATKYTLMATPINRQASADTKCGTLKVNHIGKKEITGSGKVNECW